MQSRIRSLCGLLRSMFDGRTITRGFAKALCELEGDDLNVFDSISSTEIESNATKTMPPDVGRDHAHNRNLPDAFGIFDRTSQIDNGQAEICSYDVNLALGVYPEFVGPKSSPDAVVNFTPM
jgi:hypothetical protein